MKQIRRIILILFLVVFLTGQSGYCKLIKRDVVVQTSDSRMIKATLTYSSTMPKRGPTVLLLHSLGYNSRSWGNLIPYLNKAGYAVIAMDFRGHGKSIYDVNFHQHSWVYFKPKAYQKFPNDVVAILTQAQKSSKQVNLKNFAIVGADIGANAAILASNKLKYKPKALVLISPSTNFKGLYVPIKLTEIGTIPILAMACTQDRYSISQERVVAKFAQGAFYVKNYTKGGMGMAMIGVNPSMAFDIVKWLTRFVR